MWTIHADSVVSIMANYTDLRRLQVEALAATSDTKIKARIQGITSQMDTFRFLFGLLLSELLLRHTDKMSKIQQNLELSSVEGHDIAMLTMATLQNVRSDRDFNLFWEKVELRRAQWDVVEPQLPRQRKMPPHLSLMLDTEDLWLQNRPVERGPWLYNEIGLHKTLVQSFDQQGFRVYLKVEQEQRLCKACSGET